METLSSSDTTRRNIPEDGILHSHLRENLKSCILFVGLSTTKWPNCTGFLELEDGL
jgi:hypothetical protein